MRLTRRRRGAAASALVALVPALVAGCSSAPGSPEPRGCGPVAYAEVAGRAPGYLDPPLAATPNDHALCAGTWLPPTRAEAAAGAAFVPQGLAVRGRTAWVGGHDDGPVGGKFCRVLRLDLRTGRREADSGLVEGPTDGGAGARCRHGGGLALDEHGLWLAERVRLWLLDPGTLEVRRSWALEAPVWGSVLILDGRGRLGVVGYRERRPAAVHWYPTATLVEPGLTSVTAELASRVSRAPHSAQGAFWADLDGAGRARAWFVQSTTRCGVLRTGARRLGFLPGAEGTSYHRGRLWVVSEATARPYFSLGGRPVVPELARYDVTRLREWAEADCEP
ncbi:hypothetical protein E8D34_02155 [Nocardioides sp. GY 10113]|uniref:hypothetical protein n=1 Tax=Nocardioides sp. GY 10113 TaxID=2569761 RepID=UPI0010A80949|nr:hypothetical protein [Nocardioides sp. GY 10113]TIC89308.1 hypothetical protein E8D34_02155 [Nocardioides sp. GY 10113]